MASCGAGLSLQNIEVYAPKPSPWQGACRKTRFDCFAAANARNTGACYAKHPFIVFVDDLTVLMPGWLDQIRHADEQRYLVMGAYKKVKELTVEDGLAVHYVEFQGGIDSRWGAGSDGGIVAYPASQLFGCSFGLPLEFYLAVNGSDEGCDGVGMEDVNLGIRLGRMGYKSFYNRNMLTLESEELHTKDPTETMVRKAWDTPDPSTKADWAIYNRVVQNHITHAEGNDFDLAKLREIILNGGEFPLPKIERPWFSAKPFSELE